MQRSVLLVTDHEAGRLPDRCVLSGAATTNAVRETAVAWSHANWLLGVPGVVPLLAVLQRSKTARVALAVDRAVWRRWRRRTAAAGALLAAGVVLLAVGIVNGELAMGLVGIGVTLTAAAYRTRAAHDYWVICTLDPGRGTITVEPTHPDFDRQVRALFERSLHRR